MQHRVGTRESTAINNLVMINYKENKIKSNQATTTNTELEQDKTFFRVTED